MSSTSSSSSSPNSISTLKKQKFQSKLHKNAKIAIIGTGPSGLSVALSLQQNGYGCCNCHHNQSSSSSSSSLILYERDDSFDSRKDGYGLTLTYNPSSSGPLQQLNILEKVARMDCPSRCHYVFDCKGNVLGYYGRAFCDLEDDDEERINNGNDATSSSSSRSRSWNNNQCYQRRGGNQRGNLRVPRQTLRRIMMEELLNRDGNSGGVQIQWGKKLISYSYNPITGDDTSIHTTVYDLHSKESKYYSLSSSKKLLLQSNKHPIKLYFQDGSTEDVDFLIGADGVRSVVIQKLLSYNPLSSPQSSSSSSTTTTTIVNEDNEQENDTIISKKHMSEHHLRRNSIIDVSYIGIMIILGITKDFFHPLLDERGFYTVDGNHRLFIMPFEGDTISDIEEYGTDSISNDYATTANQPSRKRHTRRYMWQISFNLLKEEAQNLSTSGSQSLLAEVLKRTEGWHSPVQEMISCTPIETIWGTPLVDRDPESVLQSIQTIYNRNRCYDANHIMRTVVLGDAMHSMTPFKGQGCNQALMDGPLLSSWLTRNSVDGAVRGFLRDMVQRTQIKVKASRDAALLFHSPEVLHENNNDFTGVKQDRIPELIHILKDRSIGAHLGADLDETIARVILEFDMLDKKKMEEEVQNYNCSADSCSNGRILELCLSALKMAEQGDTASLRKLSITSSHPCIASALDPKTKETCLHLAAKKAKCYHTCRWLLSDTCSSLEAIDVNGHSPLHAAVIGGDLKVLRLISRMSKGIEVCWSKDADGRTPFDLINIYHQDQRIRAQLQYLLTTS